MECSIIISTHNRSKLLKDCLISLANQSVPHKDYEVLVCDNYSDDKGEGSRLVCQEIKNIFKEFNLHFEKQFLKVGITQTKHQLIMKASSEIVLIGDDDYLASSKLVSNAIKSFKNNSIGIVAGALEPKYETNPPNWLKNITYKISKGYFIVDLSILDLGRKSFETEPRFALWPNMAIRKSIYINSPGFGPDGFGGNLFLYNGSGETFYVEYIKKAGFKIIYNGEMRAYHRIFPKRFTANYLNGRYSYYGIGDSFSNFRKNNFFIYLLKISYLTSRYFARLIYDLFFLPYPIKYRYLWRLKGLLNHSFFVFINRNLREYIKQDNWKDYPFEKLKPFKLKNSFW